MTSGIWDKTRGARRIINDTAPTILRCYEGPGDDDDSLTPIIEKPFDDREEERAVVCPPSHVNSNPNYVPQSEGYVR